MGIDCRFLIGGLEKWLVEKRSLTGMNARTLADLRAVPEHRNQSTLLDTEQVRGLARQGEGDFRRHPLSGRVRSSDHLPNAINLPIRPTPTREFKNEASRKLPKQPIVVPCYDRRSASSARCWASSSTVPATTSAAATPLPWEYFIADRPRPYIKEWLAENNKGWFQKAAEALAAVLSPIAGVIGLIVTIVLLACLSRLMILPFAVKAERDQIRARDGVRRDGRHQAAPQGRSGPQDARDPRLLQASRHHAGPQPASPCCFLPIMAVALLAVQDLASR